MDDRQIDDLELRALMTRYQHADSAALEELIGSVSPRLFRYFRASRFAREDAEDLLQDCWMKIHRSRHTYRASEPVMPWMFAIARHTRLDAYRKTNRRAEIEVLVASVPEPRHQEAANTGDVFEEMIAKLPDTQREVLVMLKISGMSLEEIARATASTVGAVKQKARRAYMTLRRVWEMDSQNARQVK